jgi:AsmA family protein
MSTTTRSDPIVRVPGSLRRGLRWTLISLAALAAILVLAGLAVGALGIGISAAHWRGPIANAATQALGRQVILDGPLEMIPTLRPTLTVGGIRFANPPGFSAPEFASLGRARMRIELLPLLHNEIRIVELDAEDVRLRLEQRADGHANWDFTLPPATLQQPQPAASTASPVKLEAIASIVLRRINVEYVADGHSRYFVLDEMVGEGAAEKPLVLTLRGAVEKSFPYTVKIDGGPLSGLNSAVEPWPFKLHLEFAGTALEVSGGVKDPLGAPAVDVTFGLGTQDLAELERLLQTTFPPVGATGLSGRVEWKRGQLRISGLNGVMGESTLSGELALDLAATQPRVTGELTLPVLDLRPFLVSAPKPVKPAKPTDIAESAEEAKKTIAELEKQSYSLKQIGVLDADLTVSVGKWIGVPGEVRDAQLRILIQEGRLNAPVKAIVAEVPLIGDVGIDTTAEVPDFLLSLGTERSKLGRLAEVFAQVRGVQGELGRFKLRLKGGGDNLSAIVRTFDLRLDVAQARLSYGNIQGSKPVEFKLDSLEVTIPAGRRMNGHVRGSLLGEAFSASFIGGDLPSLTREIRWPLQFEARATGAIVKLDGVLAAPEAQRGTDLHFQLSAARAGDVARWLGLARQASGAVAMEGHVRVESDEWRLSPFTVRLGNTRMSAELARVGIMHQPLLQAQLRVDNLDVDELENMLPPPDPKAAAVAMIDLPILPTGISLLDADLDVHVKQVTIQPAPVTDVSFSGHVRGGRMLPSPFSAKIAGTLFSGAMALDLRGKVPEASVWVVADKVDIGGLLQKLKVVNDLESRAELLRAELIGRGSRLGEMLERSSLLAEMESGELTVRDPNKTLQLPIKVNKGTARAAPGQPVTLDLDGAIDVTPLTIRIKSGALPDFLKTSSDVPFSLAAATAGAQLTLSGKVALPINQLAVRLELSAHGDRFDSLNQLARVQLPPWGPWELGGKFRVSNSGYEVLDLALRVGESKLDGHGSLTTTGVPPRVNVDLRAPRVQLDDFKLANWSLFEKKEKQPARPLSVEEMRAKAKEAAAQGQKLLSPEVLRSLNASLDVAVEEVLSGADKLGSGALKAQLTEGKFVLDPAEVNVPSGSAHVAFSYYPTDKDVTVHATIQVDRFDYGILARRIKPSTDMQGLFSLQVGLDARARTLDALMQHANGRIDFAVWPRDFKSGIFDLWAVNLLVALLPAVDSASESKVNCAVGRFDLRDGKLTQDKILMDTSRMRVNGVGKVDFTTEVLAFRLVPKAKTPQFLSLATPVEVTGKITDFKIGVAGSDVLETVGRLLTSIFVVPFEMLTQHSLPRDGADVCTNAMPETRR